MLIAQKKRKENIAEYVLYMWQVEDLIRANNFDMNLINQNIISKFDQPEDIKKEISDWYQNLTTMMQKENLQTSGHLQVILNLINDLFEFHSQLVKNPQYAVYIQLYSEARGYIESFKSKLKTLPNNEIELCFQALYGILIMKLKGEEISKETSVAITSFSKLLSYLSAYYKKHEEGEIEF